MPKRSAKRSPSAEARKRSKTEEPDTPVTAAVVADDPPKIGPHIKPHPTHPQPASQHSASQPATHPTPNTDAGRSADANDADDDSETSDPADEMPESPNTKKMNDAKEKRIKHETGAAVAEVDPVVMEHGRLYFLYRPKVDHPTASTIDDVQRLIMVMAVEASASGTEIEPETVEKEDKEKADVLMGSPSSSSASSKSRANGGADLKPAKLYREIIIPKKHLPRESEHAGGFAVVGKLTHSVDRMHKFLCESTYETKTRGERTNEPTRPIAEADYEIIVSGRGSKRTSHIAYRLTVPEKAGTVQSLFGIDGHRIVLQVKNPARHDESRGGFTGLSSGQSATYPERLSGLFAGPRKANRKFIPVDPPEFLNFVHAELHLANAHNKLAPYGSVKHERPHVPHSVGADPKKGAEHIRAELHMPANEHPSALRALK